MFISGSLYETEASTQRLASTIVCFVNTESGMSLTPSNNNTEVIVATGGYDHTVKLWHVKTGSCHRTFRHAGSQVNDLEITPDKQIIAAAGYQQILMYELNSKNLNPIMNYEGIAKNVTSLGFQNDGKWMFTGGEDCSARIWDLRTRNLQCQRIFQVSAPVNCVKLHPNQSEIFVGDQSGVIHLWDLKTDHNEQLIPEAEASIQDISIDPEGAYMAAVNNKGHCYIWALSHGGTESTRLNPKHKIVAHSRYAVSCEFSPDSTLLVTTSGDSTARIWKTADFSLYQELQIDDKRWVWGAAFSMDSHYMLTGSSDGIARLWEIDTATVKKDFVGHQKAITAIAFRDEIV